MTNVHIYTFLQGNKLSMKNVGGNIVNMICTSEFCDFKLYKNVIIHYNPYLLLLIIITLLCHSKIVCIYTGKITHERVICFLRNNWCVAKRLVTRSKIARSSSCGALRNDVIILSSADQSFFKKFGWTDDARRPRYCCSLAHLHCDSLLYKKTFTTAACRLMINDALVPDRVQNRCGA